MSSPRVIEWIGESQESQQVIDLIHQSKLLIVNNSIVPLPTGKSRYFFILLGQDTSYRPILDKIATFHYQPLTFSFDMSQYPLEQQKEIEQGLKNILISGLFDDFESYYISTPPTLILKPITKEGLPVYVSEKQKAYYCNKNYQELVGYDLLSADPLVWYYLSEQPKQLDVKSWSGMAIIPIRKENDMIKIETTRFITSLHNRGLIAYRGRSQQAIKLAKMWGITYLGTFNDTVILSTPQQLGFDINNALINIDLSGLPIYYWGDEWVQYVEPTLDNMAKIQYAARRAYLQVAKAKNKNLLGYLDDVKCLSNLLISAPFSSQQEVDDFQNIFKSFLMASPNWSVIVLPDLKQAEDRANKIAKRYPDLNPLSFVLPSNPNVGYLVVDTDATSINIASDYPDQVTQDDKINFFQANGKEDLSDFEKSYRIYFSD